MIISRGRNYIFVHIPKTGGTSMALALERKALADDILLGDTPKALRRRRRVKGMTSAGRLWKHSTLRDIEGLVSAQEIKEAFVFTMVRNPWDRIVSYYHWLRMQGFDHPAVSLAKTHGFSAFLNHSQTQDSLRANTYASYVTAPHGVVRCDLYVRLEHLDEDVPKLEHALAVKLGDFPRINGTDRPPYEGEYTQQDQQLVADLARPDILAFGYRF